MVLCTARFYRHFSVKIRKRQNTFFAFNVGKTETIFGTKVEKKNKYKDVSRYHMVIRFSKRNISDPTTTYEKKYIQKREQKHSL